MDFVIVTGMSGSGKTKVVNVLEDMGYFCMDNIPPKLISKFSELCMQSGEKSNKIAMVVDARGKTLFNDFFSSLDELETALHKYKVLFLDCDTPSLIRRYKETRRKHPLMSDQCPTLEQAIEQERALLTEVRDRADYIIDTSLLSVSQLRDRVTNIFKDASTQSMTVHSMSFGFKYGIPTDADLVLDVRCLPNPFYIDALREKTGCDQDVRDYVMSFEQAQGLVPKLLDLLEYLLPLYRTEGKSQLVVAFGCTGGKHRSVVFARIFSEYLAQQGVQYTINHRDITKVKE